MASGARPRCHDELEPEQAARPPALLLLLLLPANRERNRHQGLAAEVTASERAEECSVSSRVGFRDVEVGGTERASGHAVQRCLEVLTCL